MMLGLARLAALGTALALAGCVTTENSLSQADIAGMKLTGVTVSFAPDATLQWDDVVPNTPEGRASLRNTLAPRIKTGVERAMAGGLNGTRPVRLDIVVKHFMMASAVERLIVGGGRGMRADANLVDARTGATILALPNLAAVKLAGNGIVGTAVQAAVDSASAQTPADQLIELYGANYRYWLLHLGA
jgi:hypothetical protein